MNKKTKKARRKKKQEEHLKQLRKSTSKSLKLEKKVGYEQIVSLSNEYDVSYDEIKCGRMRQPLDYKDGIFSGICSLDWTPCSYSLPFSKICERQNKYFGENK